MIDVRGKPLLRRLVATLAESSIHDVTVVRGYRKEAVLADGFVTVDNDDHATTGEAASLACAAHKLSGDTVVVYGDVLFRRYILDGLLALPDDVAEASGEWVGLMKLTTAGARAVREELDAMRADASLPTADLPALLSRLAARLPIRVHYITGHWLDVDTMTDLADARNFS